MSRFVYEYAIIRVLPRVERGEFVNVGVVLYCKYQNFLQARIEVNEQRILALFPDIDLNEIKDHLKSFEQICKGHEPAGPIATLDLTSRFRWLTAKRSTVIQASELHPGLCVDAKETLESLLKKMVG
jgi:hypothetical protein